MALITSRMKEAVRLSDKIAQEDITETNELGQTVVVVPKGQPIPQDRVESKAVGSAPENKARQSKATKKGRA